LPVSQKQLLEVREESDARLAADTRHVSTALIERTKAEYDSHPNQPPVIDILIISGGGDWGAFGAGFLKGWGRIPPGPNARPQFDIVTGVSTGALIAPFAFVGDEQSIDAVVRLYRNPQKDWVKQRGMLYFLPNNISFAEVPGLEREMRETVTQQMIHQIADEAKGGRLLAVNTTNVDDGSQRAWDVGAEARRAVETGNADRVHQILLASAGIPGAFPFRIIDNEMYVDGGITGNILYGGRIADKDTFSTVWLGRYPDVPLPKIRYWVIFNNQLRPLPQVTEPAWPAVVTRSLEMSTRAATLTAMRHLYSIAEIARLKRHADIEVRIVAIPGDWSPPVPGVFIKETMNNLADLGEKMGQDPNSWMTELPPL
jgi:predicted patatin/cPLA2 family phospholipase